jgi:hypothetical protein
MMFEDADLIHCYTRADAIADGVLVDVTATAREAGFRVPVALTVAAWGDCVSWRAEDNAGDIYQDESGRLWDVLWMASLSAQGNKDVSQFSFVVLRIPRGSTTGEPQPVSLLMDIGPGDQGEPVVTIGFPQDF